MNFNEELEKLRKVKKQCLSDAKSIEDKKQEELEQAKKQITEKYSELSKAKYQELGEHNNKTDAYCKLIESYSYFSEREIGNVIASLMRTFEGINYIYQDAYYFTTQVQVLAFDKEETNVRKHPRIVIAEESKCSSYSDDKSENLNSFVKNGKAIVLVDDADTLENGIPFYRANTCNHCLEQCVKFGKFSYVKEFIDELISYKIEHSLKYIPFDELEKLKIDFISSRVEQIEENYRLVAQQQEEQMRQKLDADKENRQLQLRRLLNKKQK